jgi:hypothetical protein
MTGDEPGSVLQVLFFGILVFVVAMCSLYLRHVVGWSVAHREHCGFIPYQGFVQEVGAGRGLLCKASLPGSSTCRAMIPHSHPAFHGGPFLRFGL